jgi:hypothetical protein
MRKFALDYKSCLVAAPRQHVAAIGAMRAVWFL